MSILLDFVVSVFALGKLDTVDSIFSRETVATLSLDEETCTTKAL